MWTLPPPILIVLLLLSTVNIPHLQACSPPQGQLTGPFFTPFPGSPVPPNLKTTESDPTILLGEISIWGVPDANGFVAPIARNITIDLTTGAVQDGWPDGAVPTELPARLDDPSGGYELKVFSKGIYVALGQTNSSVLPMLIELQLPQGFFIERPETDIYFMVDGDLGIIFFSGTTECRDNGSYAPCAACPAGASCSFQENFATVLDVNQRRIIRHQRFVSNRGVHVLNPGPSNSVRDVWPSLGIVSLGFTDSCGGTGYLAYNETGVIGEATGFDPGYLSAMVDGAEQEAYIVKEQKVYDDESIYVESFAVERISLTTGDTIENVTLDTEALWELSEVPFPSVAVAPETFLPTASIATAPPSVTLAGSPSAVPTPSVPQVAVAQSDAPSVSPSTIPLVTTATPPPTTIPVLQTEAPTLISEPEETLAPFPTIFIRWMTPSPSAPTSLAPVPAVTTAAPSTVSPTTTETTVSPTITENVSEGPTIVAAPTLAPTASSRTTLAPFPTILLVLDPPPTTNDPSTEAPFGSITENVVPPTVPILTVSNFTIQSVSVESSASSWFHWSSIGILSVITVQLWVLLDWNG